MQINPLNNATEIYSGALNAGAVNEQKFDAVTRIKEDKEDSRKKADSFGADSASLDISENSRSAVSASGRIVLASEDGIVIEKEKNTREKVKEEMAAEKDSDTKAAEDKGKEPVKDLTGYTGAQVETLYREGRVSREDYEEKLEEIEKLREGKSKADEKESKVSEQLKETEKNAENEKAEKPAVKPEVKPEKASDGDDKKTAGASDDDRKAKVKENLDNDEKISKDLGKDLFDKNKDDMKAKAVKNGIENDRIDLVNQILGGRDDEEQKFNVVE